jgi:FkbM family methyltransferase
MELSPRARLTWCAHLFKSCLKQHHRELRPALSKLIRSDSVILDVGSHSGQFAKLFARLAPEGHVFAFEPGSYALSILRPALKFNRFRNVTVLPHGLGDAPAELLLSVPIKPSGSIGYGLSHVSAVNSEFDGKRRAGWTYNEESISISTIDALVADQRIDRVDFIKADIEGWEMRMLAGAEATILRHHPSLMIEVVDEHLARAGDSSNALFKLLTGFGYRAFKLDARLTRFVEITHPEDNDIFFVTDEKTLAT